MDPIGRMRLDTSLVVPTSVAPYPLSDGNKDGRVSFVQFPTWEFLFGSLVAEVFSWIGGKIMDALLGSKIVAGFNIWTNLNKTGPFDHYHSAQKIGYASLAYWLNTGKNLGVAIDYKDGANPETNFKGDRRTTIGLRIKY